MSRKSVIPVLVSANIESKLKSNFLQISPNLSNWPKNGQNLRIKSYFLPILDHCSGCPERFINPNVKIGLFRVECSENLKQILSLTSWCCLQFCKNSDIIKIRKFGVSPYSSPCGDTSCERNKIIKHDRKVYIWQTQLKKKSKDIIKTF